MASANVFMFVYAHMYVSGLRNERYIMCTYIAYIQEQNWQRRRDRQTEWERDKAQGTVPHLFFLLNGAACKKQDHSFQSSVWVQIKITVFNVDIVLKSAVGMQ